MSGQQQSQPPLLAPPRITRDAFIGVVWAGTVVATFALAFRYYVRIKCFRRLLPDDYVVGFSWTLLFATAIIWQLVLSDMYVVTETGAGLRQPTPTLPDSLSHYSRGSFAVFEIFHVGLWSIKTNFLVFFYKLGNHITYYRIAFWCIAVFTASSFFVCIGVGPYKCIAENFADMSYCASEEALRYQDISLKIYFALDVSTDALIMALPISILWNVRISTRRRFALAGVFALVVITIIIAIVRITVVIEDASSHTTSKQIETTWLNIWGFIEYFVALLVACLGSSRALFATKERSREAREAVERHQYEQENANHQGYKGALKARAKLFHDSLFDTVKETDGATFKETDEVPSISERSLRRNDSSASTMPDVNRMNSYEMQSVPTLNLHGLSINDDSRV